MAEEQRKRFIDFDAAFAERRKEPVTIKLFGEIHELPASLPAVIPLLAIRRSEEGVQEFTEGDTLTMAEALFGRERLDKWSREHGLTIDQLATMVEQVMHLYQDDLRERLAAIRNQAPPGRRPKKRGRRRS